MRPVVYRVTSKLPAVHDWRLHKLSIGTTSPGQSVRTQEVLGMCQRTPPAFRGQNSTTNDRREGLATKASACFGLDGAPHPNTTMGLPASQRRPMARAPSLQVRLSGRCARTCPSAACGHGYPKGTIRSGRQAGGHRQGLPVPYPRMDGVTGHHGHSLLVRSLSRGLQ